MHDHGIKIKDEHKTLIQACDSKQACERGKQEPIEPKTYNKRRAKQNKHVKAETKQTNKKLGFQGNDIMHARTGLCAQVRLCVHKSLPKKPKNTKTYVGKIMRMQVLAQKT